jgi:hypothetical protein
MRKIPNFGYHLARWKGDALRRSYRALLPIIVRSKLNPPRMLAFDVFAYSNEEMLPEQIASIRSFLRYVGRPKSFTVVSDGSHSDRSVRLLESVDPTVFVTKASQPPSGLPERFQRYLVHHPTGKQLALIMSLPRDGAALYVDSDVRFFPAAAELSEQGQARDVSAYYLADCQFSGDQRLLRDATEQKEPVNTGVLFLFKKLNWSLSISRFLELEGEPSFFTNQTMAHLTMHANAALHFDPAKYVLQLDDQFVFSDRYANPSLALRHYVNPVRHKFWTSLSH